MESELVNLTHMVANTNKNENELQRSILHQQEQQIHQIPMKEKSLKPKEGEKEEDLDTKVRNIIKTVMNSNTKTSSPQAHTSTTTKEDSQSTTVDTVYPTPAPVRRHTTKEPNLASALALNLGEMEEQMTKARGEENSEDDEDAENALFALSRKDGLRGREIGKLERVPTTPVFDVLPTTARPKYTLQQLLLPGDATMNREKTRDNTPINFNGNLEESYARLNDEDEAITQTTPVPPLSHHRHAMPAIAVSESHDQLEKEISLGKIPEAIHGEEEEEENDSLFEPMEVTNRMRGSTKSDDEILDSISLKNMLEQRKNYRPDSDSAEDKDKIQSDSHDDIDDTLKAAKQFESIEFHPEFTSTNGKSRGADEFAFSTVKPPQTTPIGGTTRAPETDREGPNMVDITELKMHRHTKPTSATSLSQKDVSLDDFFNSTSAMIQKKDSIMKMMKTKKKNEIERKDSVPSTEQRGKKILEIL